MAWRVFAGRSAWARGATGTSRGAVSTPMRLLRCTGWLFAATAGPAAHDQLGLQHLMGRDLDLELDAPVGSDAGRSGAADVERRHPQSGDVAGGRLEVHLESHLLGRRLREVAESHEEPSDGKTSGKSRGARREGTDIQDVDRGRAARRSWAHVLHRDPLRRRPWEKNGPPALGRGESSHLRVAVLRGGPWWTRTRNPPMKRVARGREMVDGVSFRDSDDVGPSCVAWLTHSGALRANIVP